MVPQPAVARYWAIVVVKLPEFEKIAIEPLSRLSAGLSPPSAPPIRTRCQLSAMPEPVGAEDVDAVRLADGADLARVVDRDLLGDDDDLLELRVDPDQLGHAVAHRRWRQVDHAGVEAVAGVQALAHRIEHRHVADRAS